MLRTIIQNIAAPALLLTLPLVGMAEPVVFSSGVEGGGYWSAATRLQGVAADMDLDVPVEDSHGSLHNLARLLDEKDPVSLVLAQADALQHYLDEKSGMVDKVEILENIGQECVFILTGTQSAIKTVDDLQQGKGYKLAISSPDSGVAVTYTYMTTLQPELADTSAVYTDTNAAMGARRLVSRDTFLAAAAVYHHQTHLDATASSPTAAPPSSLAELPVPATFQV